jgi:prolyl oligopeptidase
MYERLGRIFLTVALLLTSAPRSAGAASGPPPVPVEPVTDNYFGTSVVDPYRWMESGSADPRFLPLLKAQNAYTASLLAPLAAQHDALAARLLTLSEGAARVSDWQQAGGRLFFEELGPSQAVSVLRAREADGTTRTLFDPATFADAASHAAISYFQPSFDGSHVAVGIALGGSEATTIRVLDVKTGKLLPDAISRADAGNPAWRDDGKSFYYTRLQTPAPGAAPVAKYENVRSYLHVIGSNPDNDKALFGPGVASSPPLPAYGFNFVSATPGAPYLLAVHSAGTTEPLSAFVSRDGGATWTPTIAQSEHVATSGSSAIAIRGSTLYVLFQNVPNGRILSYDLATPGAKPVTVVPESSKQIEGVFGTKEAIYVEYRDGLHFSIAKLDASGATTGDISLPYEGSISGIDASPTEPGMRFGLDSWTRSLALFTYDGHSGAVADTGIIPKDPSDVSHIVAHEVMAPSTDDASVPISIITRDDIVLDGSHPTLFEGYGAYGISIDPAFSAGELEWVRRGGIIAFAHVRGGGEYGERWHLAGQKTTKQHTVDDMIATARYLIAEKYTSAQHLAVRGTSAGGIAVGGAITQHPELFGAAVDNVGATNLLRQQLTPGGPANIPEFGDATKAPDFAYMYPLDAYEHVKDGTPYPAVMCVTGVNDPRVSTWIVVKMLARLQAATSSAKPIVLRADFDAGHGIGSSRTQLVAERADEWTFLLWQLGDPEFQPKGS